MTSTEVTAGTPYSPEVGSQWFSDFISNLKADHFMLETNIAPLDKQYMYATLIAGSADETYSLGRNISAKYFIANTLQFYVQELNERQVKLNQLAFDYSRSEVLVWAEVADDDEDTIDQLILAEAKTNANSYKGEIHISTTIVEAGDNIKVPPHYKIANISKG